jgi:Glyoxalase-like domain
MKLLGSRPLELILALTAAAASSAMAQGGEPVGLDHIILHTGSLSLGSAAFARLTGVTPVVGGRHPGRGTQNALVSLGQGRYLELLAPLVDSGPAEPLRPEGWAVHTSDLTALGERLRATDLLLSDPSPGSRRLPSGGLLTWSVANLSGDDSPAIPFFIQWGTAVAHPSTTSPTGCSLVGFQITVPDTARLGRLAAALKLPIQVRAGPVPATTVTLRCPRGEVRFTG